MNINKECDKIKKNGGGDFLMFLNGVVSIKNIRKKNLPYITVWILYYAWVIVFTTWWTSSPLTDNVYSESVRTLLHTLNLIASAGVVMVIKREKFKLYTRIGAIGAVVFAILFLFRIANAQLQLAVIVFLAISIAFVNIGMLIPFVFTLNNTEKFYSVLGANFLLTILVLLQELNILNVANGIWFSFIMLLVSLSGILFFRDESAYECCPATPSKPLKNKQVFYITIALNCIYAVLCKGVGRAYLSLLSDSTGLALSPMYYIGGLFACVIYLLVYHFFKSSNHATWNITFGTFVIAMFLYLFSEKNPSTAYIFAFLIGTGSTMCMINMYYIFGVIGKKYWSMKYVRFSILFIGICGGIAGILFGKLVKNAGAETALAVAAVSFVIIVLLLIVSPQLSERYFRQEWAEDSCKDEIDNEQLYRFSKYKLSNREIQLCKLLLDGYTLRQSSAIMGVAYSTVNTYCNSIYRKININSRIELINKFKGSD